jgi:hypothetical protein
MGGSFGVKGNLVPSELRTEGEPGTRGGYWFGEPLDGPTGGALGHDDPEAHRDGSRP